MRKVILTVGLQGSGKSSWAKEQQEKNPGKYKLVSKDDIRLMLDNGKWSKNNEKLVLKIRDSIILESLNSGYDVIIHDTNLYSGHKKHISELVKNIAVVEEKDFTHIPIETCIERDLKRFHSVGEKVIRKTWEQWLKPKPPTIEYDPNLPDCRIFDIDGTLAKMNGRKPYDWDKVDTDLPNTPVIDAYKTMDVGDQRRDVSYIIVSGRDSVCRDKTIKWLCENDIGWNELYMRPEGDNRPDTIIKEEIYNNHIKGKYNVLQIFDDRDSVVRRWRELGLPCFQVDYGNF